MNFQEYKRFYFALDLKDDPALITEYERWHKKENSWPEVIQSIKDAGIANMEIYRTGNRLIMVIETTENYDHERKAKLDAANPRVQKWEELMWTFQQALPWATNGEKWVEMNRIFQL
ncbi:L-rhamnose mutarotase [Niabella yanshanensis]|uniref:L-rhamnose mutarotase n=1 Tax=Niabella yanshanensis TaxID=577386 RepID=A0ABZ0W8U3_9BACT|nr:L-rhamnose mutarotase [Niabella yanshanensis]WQD39369.1 L-rhamnose mutarotase [Niabella yanshanensis]